MSATKSIGIYEVGKDVLWDTEREAWYVRIGIMTRKGLTLHYTAFGRTPEVAANRAEVLARIMTALKPNTLKTS